MSVDDHAERPSSDREAELADALEQSLRSATPAASDGTDGLSEVVVRARLLARAEAEECERRGARVARALLERLEAGTERPSRRSWAERVRADLADSPLLRVLAASLLVHLLALPAVAWYVFGPEPQAPLRFTFLPRSVEQGAAPEEALEPQQRFEPEAEAGWGPGHVADALRLDRFRLSRTDAPSALLEALPSGDRGSVAHWVRARVVAWGTGVRFAPADLERRPDAVLARAAMLEAALDVLLIRPDDPLARHIAERLASDLTHDGVDSADGRGAVDATRTRAARYGLAPFPPDRIEAFDPATWLGAARPSLERAPETWAATLDRLDRR